jgi:two-component sensor histidine kinase
LKHGALATSSGRVTLRWRLETNGGAAHIAMTWEESDGGDVSPPERRGFGSRLLEDVVSHELEGSAELDFKASGLVYRLSFPVD